MQKYNREIIKKIEFILHNLWDPIGIRDEKSAIDEYKIFAPMIYRELYGFISEQRLVDILDEIRTKQLGLPSNKSASVEAAAALRSIPLPSENRGEKT